MDAPNPDDVARAIQYVQRWMPVGQPSPIGATAEQAINTLIAFAHAQLNPERESR